MSRRATPQLRDIIAIQLTAKARTRWQRRNFRQDQMHNQLCQARALLAKGLGIGLDPDNDVCACCADGEPPSAAGLDDAARKAFDLLTLAFAESLAADELLSEVNEATAQHIDLLSRKR
ncbi:hypothetical protein [uncultured Aquabacterium sp.]|uniref:hypothetical protein n=1 Tax=Aquabacterium commune TaxID=70586 RepID=UPI0030D4C595|tara:strand:+ start:2675 stop:3031 length:357 start_codon:yes stop_codon:yes gene_type:complete